MKEVANSITSKFNLYDHIGYLIVGASALMLTVGDVWLYSFRTPYWIPSFNLETSVLWIIAAYFVGHVIQAVANLIIRERKGSFSDSERQILSDARAYFGYEEASDDEVFQNCYMLACAKDITGHVTAFNAYYSLYRGWLILTGAESIFVLINMLVYGPHPAIVLILAGLLGVTLLMAYRRKRFWKYLRSKTLQTYVVLRRLGV